jgi:glycosyltransferase involved in cell wall biosynthesis
VRASGAWLLEICARVRPEAIHLNGYAHAALAWSSRPLVVGHSCVLSWFDAVHRERAPARFDRYREEVSRGLRGAGMVVAPTHAMLRALDRFYGPLPHTRVIWNARDWRLFEPVAKEPLVLAAGRLWDAAKNLRPLDQAAPQCPWPVYVAGDCRHPSGDEARADHVRFLGSLEPEDLHIWMARAAIYASPALYEPFGLSILEAALSGCALVLGDIPSLRELWAGMAVFVDPRDPAAIAEGIRWLASHDADRLRLADLARRRALQMDPDLMATQYLSAYAALRPPAEWLATGAVA